LPAEGDWLSEAHACPPAAGRVREERGRFPGSRTIRHLLNALCSKIFQTG
jgi:hypothetical protein